MQAWEADWLVVPPAGGKSFAAALLHVAPEGREPTHGLVCSRNSAQRHGPTIEAPPTPDGTEYNGGVPGRVNPHGRMNGQEADMP